MYNLSITMLRKIKTQVLCIPLIVIAFLPADQINKKKNLIFFSFACFWVSQIWKKKIEKKLCSM